MPGSIREWLEGVKAGYGDRFLGAFEEVGVEDTSDLAELEEEEAFQQLDRALEARGAKFVQLQKIRKALLDDRAASRTPHQVPAAGPASRAAHPALKAMRSLGAAPEPRVEKALLKNVFGVGLPLLRPKAPQALAGTCPQGYTVLKAGEGPRVYVVHGIDGDYLAVGAVFRHLAALLGSCQVVALEYNDGARTCGTLPELAALYNERILHEAQIGPRRSIYIAGHAMGCILAHQMALQFQGVGAQVGLLLFGAEVVWPAEGTRRMGGYEWLGGSIESALHAARSLGAVDFAEAEVRSLLPCRAEERDANKLHMRVYWKHCGPRGMSHEEFQQLVGTGARNMDVLRVLMWGFQPTRTFDGYTLLALAPESPEFEAAREINARHCICLKTICVKGTGSVYNMLEGSQAPLLASAVLACLREQGEQVGEAAVPAAVAFAPVRVAPVSAAAPAVTVAPVAVAPVAASGAASLAPQAQLEDVRKALLGMVNGMAMDPLDMDSNLMDSGFDSISMSLLVQQISLDFAVDVQQSTISEMETLDALAEHIHRLMPAAKTPALAAQTPALAAQTPALAAQVFPVQAPQPVLATAAVGAVGAAAAPGATAAVGAAAAAASGATVAVGAAVPVAATPAATAPADLQVQGLEELHKGSGPRVYMVHGIDGDIWGVGNAFRSLAPLLSPCHSCALACDEEALANNTLPELAATYNRRVRADSQQHPQRPVFILGYSMGCVIAHQMALQLENAGMAVGLVMVDFEISWPPGATTKRVGGYEWLGGDIEAALLMTRAMGVESQTWAAHEIEGLLSKPPRERDANTLQARAFQEIASRRRGFRLSDFNAFVTKGSRNMDRLNTMAGNFKPTGTFLCDALLVLAPESPENSKPALEINAKYCARMQVAQAAGTHYNILTPEKVPAAARAILEFMHGLGHAVPATLKADVKGLECLHDGGDGPRVYMVHGIDANLYGVGTAYKPIAPLLAPCCCSAMAFDEEAMECKDFDGLVSLYCLRAWKDAQVYPGRPIVVMGYSMGCVIAHAMALKFQGQGVTVTLVLIDFEISWPPGPTDLRIGGYEWLGGELEAPLLIARSFGRDLQLWTAYEVNNYLKLPEKERNMASFQGRIFERIAASRKGFNLAVFETMTTKGGGCMERLHQITGNVTPAGVFHGDALLVLAPDSPENTEPALRINGQYTSNMEVVRALGTHYSILQPENALATARRVLRFLHKLKFSVPATLQVKGLKCLHDGDGPRVYMVHGIDANLYEAGLSYKAVAPMLAPCSCFALEFDQAAQECKDFQGLVDLYCRRMWEDAKADYPERPIVIMGYSTGCVTAHAMALVYQAHKANVSLVLIDSEITWPPEPTPLRTGGYEWLGGDVEAPLLICRSLSPETQAWAAEQTLAYVALPKEQRDAAAFKERIFEKCAAVRKGYTRQLFELSETKGGHCMDRLHAMMGDVVPAAVFDGPALMVRAPDSPENAEPAQRENAKFCSNLQSVDGLGTHFTMLQEEGAPETARVVLEFLNELSRAVEPPIQPEATLREEESA